MDNMREAFVEMFGTDVPVEVEAKVSASWGREVRSQLTPASRVQSR